MLWANPSNRYVWVVLLVTLGFGLLGFLDDYYKVTKRTSDGLSGPRPTSGRIGNRRGGLRWLIVQLGHAAVFGVAGFPFFKELVINFGWFSCCSASSSCSAPPMR